MSASILVNNGTEKYAFAPGEIASRKKERGRNGTENARKLTGKVKGIAPQHMRDI